MNNKKFHIIGLATLLFIAVFSGDALASAPEIWFSRCPLGQRGDRVTEVRAGDRLWIVVFDPDRNIDSAEPDRIAAIEISVFNPNTRLELNPAWLAELKDGAPKRYLEETGPNTGYFVLSEAIIIGARVLHPEDVIRTRLPLGTHIPAPLRPLQVPPLPEMWIIPLEFALGDTFRLGGAGQRDVARPTLSPYPPRLGRFVDGDTLIGFYISAIDQADAASAMVQIIRTEATITWDKTHYPDIEEDDALIRITDPDENLDPMEVEEVPIFIIVNPGSWNPVEISAAGPEPIQFPAARGRSATNFQMLFESGGVEGISVDPALQTPPVALPNTYTIQWRGILRVAALPAGVLANDIVAPDGAPLRAVLVRPVCHGVLDLRPDGSFTFTPPPDFHGVVTFTYRAEEDIRGGVSEPATVSITVLRAGFLLPVAVADLFYTVPMDLVLTAGVPGVPGVLANDTDPDGNFPLRAVLVRPVSHGVLDLRPDGSFTFSPPRGFFGIVTFTYRAVDSTGGVSGLVTIPETTVTITVAHPLGFTPPVALPNTYTIPWGEILTVPALGVLANDTVAPVAAPLSAVLVERPAHGVLDLRPDGSFTFTPPVRFFGIVTFTYHARDVRGGVSGPATVTITVTAPDVPPPIKSWVCRGEPIRWYNIYDPDRFIVYVVDMARPGEPMRLINNEGRGYGFDTLNVAGAPLPGDPAGPGLTRIVFFAQETGANTGIFELRLIDIQRALGFTRLRVEYVLAAFYVDPNDFSDVAFDTAYAIRTPVVSPQIYFAAADWTRPEEFDLGRDRINVEVMYSPLNRNRRARDAVVVQIFSPQSTDREWIILDEVGVNAPIFRARTGLGLYPVVWAGGIAEPPWAPFDLGNKDLETFNRSAVIVQFNAVEVASYPAEPERITYWYAHYRVAFAEMEVSRTLVFDGKTGRLNMRFVDAAGVPVIGYTIAEAAFIEVYDPDQNEDNYRRESLVSVPEVEHPSILIEVFNSRTNVRVRVVLWETEIGSGLFRSVTPIRLVEHLGARTGDTILAFFQDPSDPGDAALIATRVVAVVNRPPVAVADTYPVLMDTVLTVPAPGVLANDTDPDNDPLRAQLVTAPVHGVLDLRPDGSFTFTPPAGWHGIVTFTYRALDDRGGISDITTVTITVKPVVVVPPPLEIDEFIVVHERGSRFSFKGVGVAETFTIRIFNMLGREVRDIIAHDVGPGEEVVWDGRDEAGVLLAKGPYIFVAVLRDGAIIYTFRGTVFRK
ncbi:Ig-like domain-containing protein [Candidatus Acetothermia bacterium]|nr:Ig-like domain-containing protein [Candidatus Acetothermia bacterium]